MSTGTPKSIKKQLLSTFFSLRLGTGIIGVLFPIILGTAGYAAAGHKLRDSLSAYYCDGRPAGGMRDVFVGGLFAIGVCLYLYKGFSKLENFTLNFAGAMAVGIALFPMPGCGGPVYFGHSPHFVFAVLFFTGIVIVTLFCSDDTLFLIRDANIRKWYRALYRLESVVMVGSIAAVTITNYIHAFDTHVFAIEVAGIWSFAFYWFTKTWELAHSEAEKKAIEAKSGEAPIDSMEPAA